jgi:LCP family protein required for cell wall assembly
LKMKKRTVVLISALSVLALCLVAAVVFYLRINDPKNVFSDVLQEAENTPEPTEEVLLEPSTPTPTAELPPPSPTPTVDPVAALEEQADADFAKNRVNILLLGIDRSAERENWGSFRTDTMLLLTIDFDRNDVDLISIPRDSYVRIFNTLNEDGTPKYAKINSAFAFGGGAKKNGYKYAAETVSYVLGGVKIHYYVAFDMQVVKDVTNAMGGVYYDVDIEVHMNGRTIMPGYQHLDGQAVLDYCRQRKGSSDIARIDRQQRMLIAIFNQLKSTRQIFNIPSIYQAVASNIDTSLSFEQVCALALFATRIEPSDIERHTLSGKGLYFEHSSFWVLDMGKVKSLVQTVFGIKKPAIDWDIDIGVLTTRIEEEQKLMQELAEKAQELIQRAHALEAQQPELLGAFDGQIRALQELLNDGSIPELSDEIAQFEALINEIEGSVAMADPEETPPPDEEDGIIIDDDIDIDDGIDDGIDIDDEIGDDIDIDDDIDEAG